MGFWDTLQGINISHLGKMKIIFKYLQICQGLSSSKRNHHFLNGGWLPGYPPIRSVAIAFWSCCCSLTTFRPPNCHMFASCSFKKHWMKSYFFTTLGGFSNGFRLGVADWYTVYILLIGFLTAYDTEMCQGLNSLCWGWSSDLEQEALMGIYHPLLGWVSHPLWK